MSLAQAAAVLKSSGVMVCDDHESISARCRPEVRVGLRPFGGQSPAYAYVTSRGNYLLLESCGERLFLMSLPTQAQFEGGCRYALMAPCVVASRERFISLLRNCRERLGPLVMKGIKHDLLAHLAGAGVLTRNLAASEWWHPDVPFDDHTYPEVLLRTQGATEQGSLYAGLMSELDRGRLLDESRAIYQIWEREWLRRRGGESPFFSDFFDAVFHLSFGDRTRPYVVGLWRRAVYVGFMVCDPAAQEEIDLIAGVCDRAQAKLSTAIRAVRAWALCHGFKRMNLGGSETQSLHSFKCSIGGEVSDSATIVVLA